MNKEKLLNDDQVKNFVKTNHDYYINQFERIGNSSKYVLSFNISAFLFGSIWYSFRNIWNWSLAFLIIETFAIVQVARGFFGNISAEAYSKIEKVQSTLDFRMQQLQAAIEKNSDKLKCLKEPLSLWKIQLENIWLKLRELRLLVFGLRLEELFYLF